MPPKKARKSMCLRGCGDIGIEEYKGICLDCYTKETLLRDRIPLPPTIKQQQAPKISKSAEIEQWQNFKSVPRELSGKIVVDDEVASFASKVTTTHENNLKLQQYMMASDAGEEVDHITWCKNQPNNFTPT
ncbi:hypothetical protein THRCLA_20980, partial [Thraustotheca clavata]